MALQQSMSLIRFNESADCMPLEKTEEQPHQVHEIVALILGPLNAVLNGVCIQIFKHSTWRQSAMSRILKGLSIVELCMGLSLFAHALISKIITKLHENQLAEGNDLSQLSVDRIQRNTAQTISLFILSVFFNLSLLAFQIARNWTVVLLAAYRYDRICRPIGTGTAIPQERISIIICAVAVISCVIVVPRAFEFRIIVCRIHGLCSTIYPVLLQSRIYQIAYYGVVMFVVQSGGPVICVCVLSAFVIRLIAKRRAIHRINEQKSARHLLYHKNEELSPANTADTRPSLTSGNAVCTGPPIERPAPAGDKLIFAVCITFFIFETPAFFSKILNPYLEQNYQTIDSWLSVIANILIYLDSTLNAFVYMASNPTFRKIAYEQFVQYRLKVFGQSHAPKRSVPAHQETEI